MKYIASIGFLILLSGCATKEQIAYYLPQTALQNGVQSKHISPLSVESASYLASDKIWYYKEGVFLPYQRSFMAKLPGEYIRERLESSVSTGRFSLAVSVRDAYQLYGQQHYFVLKTHVLLSHGGTVIHEKDIDVNVSCGMGPAEAVRGFSQAVDELCRLIDIYIRSIR